MTLRLSLTLLILLHAGAHAVIAQTRTEKPPARRGGATSTPASPVTDVKLDALKAKSTPLPARARNPFRFNEAPVPIADRPGGDGRSPRGGFTAPPPAPVAAVPEGPPPPPPIQLRFIGLIDAPQQAGRVALLSDGKGGLMNGREGDIIEGRYRVLRIGADSLDLAYADGRGRQTIRLSGQ